jgi:hypothetical protein
MILILTNVFYLSKNKLNETTAEVDLKVLFYLILQTDFKEYETFATIEHFRHLINTRLTKAHSKYMENVLSNLLKHLINDKKCVNI